MFQGKTHTALQLLTDKGEGGILHLHDTINNGEFDQITVKDVLKSKPPPQGQPATLDSIYRGMPTEVNRDIFDPIDASLIRSIALSTRGAAGPSGLDAYMWRRMCTSYKTASSALCQSLALTAKCLCTTPTDPRHVSPLLACRLMR